MSALIAALPMYDWPELQSGNDVAWAAIRVRLRSRGIDAPERLARERTDLHALWRDPALLLSQTCWGPMELGLAAHVRVVAQPDYSAYEGGEGELYSSAIVMRADAPRGGGVPVNLLRGLRFAFNSADSRSGYLGLKADLEAAGEGLSIFRGLIETGGHRASIGAVADGRADVAAVDCKTWHLARQHEPAARNLRVVGWTTKRRGLPFITASGTNDAVAAALAQVLSEIPPP